LSEPRDFGEPITHDELLDFHGLLADDALLGRRWPPSRTAGADLPAGVGGRGPA
jgi:hypothetical protein